MRYQPIILLVASLVFSASGCDSWVEDVDPPINQIGDPLLTDESQVEFLIKGVQTRFATTYTMIALHASGQSDELIYSPNNERATFQGEVDFDWGLIPFANFQTTSMHGQVGELRYFSDALLERIEQIEFEDPELKKRAQFAGKFYGGIARYFLATYFGLSERQGGGVITDDVDEPGPFIPSPEMYQLALEKLSEAKSYADASQLSLINVIVARIHLFQGDFSDARTAAAGGLRAGDAPFESLHASGAVNRFWERAGPNNYGWTFDPIYNDFVASDPNETIRLPFVELVQERDSVYVFYGQTRYVDRAASIAFATWQENELVLAELDLRDGNAGGSLTRINEVRASHGIDPLDSADMSILEVERRKELWSMGLRLVDQRRLGSWHLTDNEWWYFPIPQTERDINPNL